MAVTTLQGLFNLDASGKAIHTHYITDDASSGTAAATGSGYLNLKMEWNTLGTTRYGTLADFPRPAGLTSPMRLLNASAGGNRGGTINFSNIYKIGTMVFTSTGNQFTHDAATFPILKKQMGTSQAINGKLIMIITTATSVTAPVMTINYTNQAGASITGTRTWTAPAAATAVAGTYQMILEEGDTAVQDLTSINITTASSTGAATFYLMEEHTLLTAVSGTTNTMTRSPATDSFCIPNINNGAATSGTAVTYFMPVDVGLISNTSFQWQSKIVYDS